LPSFTSGFSGWLASTRRLSKLATDIGMTADKAKAYDPHQATIAWFRFADLQKAK
jgi:hypothetical protein